MDQAEEGVRIDSYRFGHMVIAGKAYSSDVFVFPKRVESWWRRESHRVYPEDLEEILREEPEILVVGTGAYGLMKLLPETKEKLSEAGIEIREAETGEAVRIYNKLSEEGKKVVGAFHLTC